MSPIQNVNMNKKIKKKSNLIGGKIQDSIRQNSQNIGQLLYSENERHSRSKMSKNS